MNDDSQNDDNRNDGAHGGTNEHGGERGGLPGYGFCFPGAVEDPATMEQTRGAARSTALWKPGDRLTIAFLDGSAPLHERVRGAANEWLERSEADLDFEWLEDSHQAAIRISFRHRGSWSMIGTECHKITDVKRATMNFGALSERTEDALVRKVVLHEFGHALGLLHEHKHPERPFKWDKEQVYDALLGPPNNWSREQVARNLFTPFDKDETVLADFDPDSIMIYPVPANWTIDGTEFPGNDDLSTGDIELVSLLYCG